MTGRRGFTVIELLIVICIIGIISGIAIPRLHRAQAQARAADVVGAMRAVRIAATFYHDSAGTWPPTAAVGVQPSGLEDYLPHSDPFTGTGWMMHWERLTVVEAGRTIEMGSLTVVAQDADICPAVSRLLGGPTSELSVLCGATNGTVTELIAR